MAAVLEKRAPHQALNVKEFAVLAGVSYSTAREWFRVPGFPVFRGVVFWNDFEEWRRAKLDLTEPQVKPSPEDWTVFLHTSSKSCFIHLTSVHLCTD